ncbi:PEPxxWA-CTERM sorting domain-containing protein [Sandaracinobacteroides sp. A072]|uniref:PEPxxWA-CTERM sorting domain-containing protein n=1 Tax=Sandaracinobacteroides sp. A072 TaxID=3461146 RepID=UPI0040412422
MNKLILATAAACLAGPVMAAPVDLSSWTAEGGGNWNLQPGNNSVLQTVNGTPTVFYGPGNAQGLQLSGTIQVKTTSDDDFIGFVLGYHAGDLAAASTNFLVVDWKQTNQNFFGCLGQAGLSISLATQGLGDNAGAWCHQGNGVTELARATNLGATGWVDNQEYSFDLIFTASNVQVFVDGVKEIDINGSFADGAFGFYNYSQSNVLYAGITEDVAPPVPGVPEPATWAMLIAGFGLVGGVARRRRAGLPQA